MSLLTSLTRCEPTAMATGGGVDSSLREVGAQAATAALLRELAPSSRSTRPVADAALRQRVEQLLGAGPADWAAEVAGETSAAIVDKGFESHDAPTVEIEAAAEGALLIMLLRLSGHAAPALGVTSLQSEIVRHRIAHAVPFHRVVSSQRLAQHSWADHLLAAAVRRGAGPEVMRSIVSTLDLFFDETIDWHLRCYLAEQERFLRSKAAERARLIEALIAGRDVDIAVAGRRLGTDLADGHLAVVLAAASVQEGDADGRLQQVVTALSRSAHGAVVAHRPAPGSAWLWLAGADESVRVMIEPLARTQSVLAGIGGPHRGAPGFRRGHLEAAAALGFARHPVAPVVLQRDIALASLLSGDPERARWFVQQQLGSLTGTDPKNAELRDTLAEYYRAGTRLSAAADALHIHRNTLIYRLRQITGVLGHPAAERMPEVYCALVLAAWLGDAVLDAGAGAMGATGHTPSLTAPRAD